jgi:hypothetical protein
MSLNVHRLFVRATEAHVVYLHAILALLVSGAAYISRPDRRASTQNTIDSPALVVTFAVSSGPGRVAGVHNGDAKTKSHERQATSTRSSYATA